MLPGKDVDKILELIIRKLKTKVSEQVEFGREV